MNPLVPFLAAGAVGLFVLSRKSLAVPSSAAPGSGPQPLRAGVPYLFILRLNVGVTDEQARSVLDSKGVENLVLAPALNPPFWAAGSIALYSERLASFKATPKGNSNLALGDPFYGIGRVESLVRLDGQSFAAKGPTV